MLRAKHIQARIPAMPRLIFQALALLCISLAGPLFALKVTLKSEEKPFEATPLKLNGKSLTFKRGSKEVTLDIDLFVPESAYELKKALTAREGKAQLELARFGLHRDLFSQAREAAGSAAVLDKSLGGDLAQLVELIDSLESEALFSQANTALDASDVEGARKTLNSLGEKFKGTSAARRGEALLSTLDQLAAELKARQLEDEARKAQDAADAELRKKRQATDDWLYEFEVQLGQDEQKLKDAEVDADAGRTSKGLGAMEEIVSGCTKIRDSLNKNQGYLIYRGQPERAIDIDARAKRLTIDAYERWANHLFSIKNFALASKICERALELDPKDRRLIALKVDIDEVYDKKSVLDGINPPGSGD